MIIKEGVIMQGLQIEMRPALKEADEIWRSHGQELTITSALDSTHSAGSLHYYGRALDLRTRFWDEDEYNQVADELRAAVGNHFDVVVHKSHIHIEYDPRIAKPYPCL